MKFLESNKILNNHQHGFRKKRSSETQLLFTVRDLAALTDVTPLFKNEANVTPLFKNEAKVTPLFKNGDKSKAANYKPVFLISTCCKIIEHIILSSYEVPGKQQYTEQPSAWLPEKEILWDSTAFYSTWPCSTDRRHQIDAILSDFRKAFDEVLHQRFAAKLYHYGIRDQAFSGIRSSLTDRSHQVILDGKSSSAPDTSGVPQGIVLVLSCTCYTPSWHMMFIQRRLNVDATSWRCIDIEATLCKHHAPAGHQPAALKGLHICTTIYRRLSVQSDSRCKMTDRCSLTQTNFNTPG